MKKNVLLICFCVFLSSLVMSGCGSTSKLTPGSQGVVAQFDDLAQKLLQPAKKGGKATYAFLDFATDEKNVLVERYITDALTEAVFNTGSVKIIERIYIEKILNEQMFQASGYISDDTAASIGNAIGAEYVCYGTIKDIGEDYIVYACVVDVESAEICAMSRATIKKDEYLAKIAVKGTAAVSKTEITPKTGADSKSPAKKNQAKSLWTCIRNQNDFDGCTVYTFTCTCSDGAALFFGYEKRDNPLESKVRACQAYTNSFGHEVDIKLENGTVAHKKLEYNFGWGKLWYYKTGTVKVSENAESYKIYSANASDSKEFFNYYKNNDVIRIRETYSGDIHSFQTAGFMDILSTYGITEKEILDALTNEGF